MNFIPSYYEIRLPNKDIKVVVNYLFNNHVSFTYCYNSISGTYTGLQCDSFTDSLRGLLRTYPLFFEDLSECSYEKDLKEMGFTQVAAPEKIKALYESLNPYQ